MHVVLERVVTEIADEMQALTAETAQLHPHGNAHEWSPQQIVEHLILGYRVTTCALQSRLDKGRLSRRGNRTRVQWLLQIMILSFGRLPRGAPARDEETPVEGGFPVMSGEQLAALLRQEAEAMDAALDACRHKFGMERVAPHPLLGFLRVDQWRRYHVVHGLHHVAQLRSVVTQVTATPVPIRINSRLAKEPEVPAERPVTKKNAV
jgi:DinB superfamily